LERENLARKRGGGGGRVSSATYKPHACHKTFQKKKLEKTFCRALKSLQALLAGTLKDGKNPRSASSSQGKAEGDYRGTLRFASKIKRKKNTD